MPPFEYGGYRSPYVQSISALLEAPGQIEAQRAQTVGAAQARAAQQRGQAWGNAVQTAGSAIGGAIAQEADPKTKIERLQLAEAQRSLQSRTALGKIVSATPHVDENGVSLYDIPAISKQLETAGFGDHVGDVATQLKGVNDAFRAEQAAKLALVQRGAQALLQAGSDPGLTLHLIDTLDKNRSLPSGDLEYYRQLIIKDPSKTQAILRQFAGPEKLTVGAKGGTIVGETTGAIGATLPDEPKTPTEASLAYDLTNTDPAIRARATTALSAMKQSDIKPGTIEDWVMRARTLAGQGRTLSEQEKLAVDTKAIEQFKALSRDPDMAALTQSNAQLRNAMLQLQLGQQPTPDDAKTIAQQMIDHKMAPSQLSLFGGFGTAGAAFKRMVGVEALKLDPNFDWEQSEADYQFSKTPQFQNTTRLMGSIMESIPHIMANAKLLANGNVRSINTLINQGKTELNNVDLKKFKTDAVLVGDEIAKILAGGGSGSTTSDAKLAQGQALLQSSDSPEALAATLDEVNTLLGYRHKTLVRGTYLSRQPETTKENGVPVGVTIQRTPVTR